MVARAQNRTIVALPLIVMLVALALMLTARNVFAPVMVDIRPMPLASSVPAPSAPTTVHPSPPAPGASQDRPQPGATPPVSRVKTGDANGPSSSCTSRIICPR